MDKALYVASMNRLHQKRMKFPEKSTEWKYYDRLIEDLKKENARGYR